MNVKINYQPSVETPIPVIINNPLFWFNDMQQAGIKGIVERNRGIGWEELGLYLSYMFHITITSEHLKEYFKHDNK